jgi:uncharacterized membrane protein
MDQHDAHNDAQQNRLWAAMSYVCLLSLVPLFFRKRSKFTQFHARQGLTLVAAEMLIWMIGGLLRLVPFFGWLLVMALWVTVVVWSLRGIRHAFASEWWEIPFLGEYAKEIKM